jgi:hypothetical protein
MGTGQLHYDQYIRACDLFGAGEITEEEFRTRMDRLGYSPHEIDEEIEAVNEMEWRFA